jgi:hypothetical protein
MDINQAHVGLACVIGGILLSYFSIVAGILFIIEGTILMMWYELVIKFNMTSQNQFKIYELTQALNRALTGEEDKKDNASLLAS